MRITLTLPLRYVSVMKVDAGDVPAAEAGDLRTYYFGHVNPGRSLPITYSLEGWLVAPPKVGAVVQVLRTWRNGVALPGIFISTPVTAVPNEGEFHTVNSKYLWKVAVPELAWPPAALFHPTGEIDDPS